MSAHTARSTASESDRHQRRLDEIRYKLRHLVAQRPGDAFFFPIRHAALVKLESELTSRAAAQRPHRARATHPKATSTAR